MMIHKKYDNQLIQQIIAFISETYRSAKKEKAVIAVSGGIDSAVALTLLVKALGPESVHPLLLPYGDQDMTDAKDIITFNTIHASQVHEIDIKPAVDKIVQAIDAHSDQTRLGNIMARTRMIYIFDLAKQLDALVCGTENKSEKYLAYYTRFGDEASDLEPLQDLYKTKVIELAKVLAIPEIFMKKAPSAGLWQQQTDESELGFSYEIADRVLEQYVAKGIRSASEISHYTQLDIIEVEKVLKRVQAYAFKLETPYVLDLG